MRRHFLITRYCIGDHRNWAEGEKEYLKIDDDWINHRHQLFEKYTYPSVMGQSSMDFTWLILCSDYMKRWSMSYLNNKNIRVIYGFNRYFKDDARAIAPVIRDLIRPEDDLIITTRLDSDDAIAVDFMEKTSIISTAGKTLTWEKGYRLYNGEAYLARHTKNHFISFAETSKFNTVYQQSHRQMISNFPHDIVSEPGWLEVIHDRNAKNTAESYGLTDKSPRVEFDRVRKLFSL